MDIVFYSTGCPRCRVLKAELDRAGLRYSEVNDVDKMLSLGISNAPSLAVDGRMMAFPEAFRWVKEREEDR